MWEDMGNTNGYWNDSVHGHAAYENDFNKEPIVEDGSCGTVHFPVRMFKDHRSHGDDILLHVHRALEIHYMLSGEATTAINNVRYSLRKGSVVLINAYDVHMITGDDADYLVIQVEPDLLNSYGVDLRQYMPSEKYSKVLEPEEETAIALGNTISRVFEQGQEVGEAARVGVLSELFRMFAQIMAYTESHEATDNQVKYDQRMASRLKEIFSYVKENYTCDITVDEIARQVHLTKNYFCRFFKQITGTTFIEYLNMYRCQQAEELMRNSDMTITAIASQVGFKNLSYFNKTYKKLRGETPSRNRKQIFRSNSNL